MTPDERIAELEGVVAQQHAVIAQQREQITVLLAEIQDLRGQLAKDSHNSHKPPTSDGLQRRPWSQRRPSGRKSGGQVGHQQQSMRNVGRVAVSKTLRHGIVASRHQPADRYGPPLRSSGRR